MNDLHPNSTSESSPEPPLSPQRLRRSPNGTIGGVATGVANCFGLDPAMVKLSAVALLVLSGGMVFFLYLAAWLLIPPESDPDPTRFAFSKGTLPLAAGSILTVLTLSSSLNVGPFGGALIGPTILIGGGLYLLNQRDAKLDATAPNPPVRPASATSEPPRISNYDWAIPRADGASQASPVHSSVRQREAKPPGPPITSFTLAAAAIVVGSMALLSNAFGLGLGAVAFFSATTAIIGAGLVASAILGRALLLIPLGLASLGALGLAPLADTAVAGGVGPRSFHVTDVGDLAESYELGAGELILDLSDLEFTQDEEVLVRVGAGYAQVIVPPEANVSVKATSDFGTVSLFGREVSGIANSIEDSQPSIDTKLTDAGDKEPQLTITVDVTFGAIEIKEGQP